MINSTMRTIKIAGLFAVLCLSQSLSAADLAGKVVFVRGTPTAVDAANAVRALAKGSEVFAGDKLVSGNGKIQVSMIDGAFVSVQPESEFAIETYKFAGKADGTENAAMRLVKGGVRAVTGVIGKDNPEAYKLHTSVATIGIRGTGYNTRICAGDCRGRTDGLYHNTWEGTTYVANNVETRDVPSRNGVYVKDINAPIEVLAQVAGVTAIDDGEALAAEEKKAEETSTVVASGDQRNDEGIAIAVTGTATGTNKVLNHMVGEHVNNNDDGDPFVDLGGLDNGSIFFNAAGQPIGFLFTEEDNGIPTRGFATVDLSSMLAANDPAAVAEVRSLMAANATTPGVADKINALKTNPAKIADAAVVDGVGYFRWTGGNLLVMNNKNDSNGGLAMTGNQSVHIIFGPEYTTAFPTTGSATYLFSGGTRSTSESGATIGNGVTAGSIVANFATSIATLNMTVNHLGAFGGPGNYNISGPVTISRDGGLGLNGSVPAFRASAPGSACTTGCTVVIEGGFPGVLASGVPVYAGIAYDIRENDEIIGVAVFKK